MKNINIAIANDHAGFELKKSIIDYLENFGYKSCQENGFYPSNNANIILDLGCYSSASVDYPDYAKKLALVMENQAINYGILICATGIGMSIAINRYPQIRGALCITEFMAMRARAHNDANVLVLGSCLTNETQAAEITQKFLSTEFEGGRHADRVKQLGLFTC